MSLNDSIEIQYRCMDCGHCFPLAITPLEEDVSLWDVPAESCPKCAATVRSEAVTCPECGQKFVAYFPHIQVGCDLATLICPSCSWHHESLCIC